MTRGEITPQLHARTDLALFQSALKACVGFIPRREGGVMSRPGTRFVAKSGDTATSRLIRFVWSRDQSYLVEFGVGKAWFVTNGARLTVGEPVTDITAVTSATENGIAAVSVSAAFFTVQTYIPHGWATGQRVRIYGVTGTGEIDHINGEHVIEVTGASLLRVPRPTSGAAAWISSTAGRVAAFVEITTPYTAADLPNLRTAQQGDVMTVVSGAHPVHELRRTSARAFSFVAPDYSTGPFQRENRDEGLKIHASAETGSVTLTANRSYFTADMVGMLIRLDARSRDEAVWEPTSAIAVGNIRRYEENTYLCTAAVVGVNSGTTPPTHTFGRQQDGGTTASKEWLYLHSGWGVARITGFTSGTSVSASVVSRLPAQVVGGATTAGGPTAHVGDGTTRTFAIAWATSSDPAKYEATLDGVMQATTDYAVDPAGNTITFNTAPAAGVAISIRQLDDDNRTDLWRLGAWGGDQGYPKSVTFLGDRLIFGGTPGDPQRFDATRVGEYDEFDPSVPLVDSDPISSRLAGLESSPITDLTTVGDLFAMTGGGVYRISAGGAAFTPANIDSRLHHAWGAADIPAATVGKAAIYVQRGSRAVRELAQLDDQTFEGAELTVAAGHLFGAGKRITAMAYADQPYGLLWVVRSDGLLLSLTYLREQEVLGWARHPTDGLVKDVCVVPEGEDDVVYLTVERTVGGQAVRYIERATEREPALARDIVCVDCSLTYEGFGSGTVSLADTFGVLSVVASGSVFAPTDVGRDLWVELASGVKKLTVTGYSSPTTVVASAVTGELTAPDYGVPSSSWGFPVTRIGGLTHLVGKSVVTQVDGRPGVQGTVAADGTLALGEPALLVHVGLAYQPYIETLPVNFAGQTTVRTRAKAIPKVAVLVTESRVALAGTTVGELYEIEGRDVLDGYGTPEPYTGLWEIDVANTWEDTGQVQVWQTYPLPLTVLAVLPEVKGGGG
jgi:hypothetical protein